MKQKMRIYQLAISVLLCISVIVFARDSFAQDTNPNYRKGIEYAAEGKFREAQGWFEDNLKSNKSDSTSISSLGVINDLNDGKITDVYARSFFAGLNHLQNGKIEEALKEMESLIESKPGYPRPYNVVGVVYASLGDRVKSKEYFQKAVEIDPEYSVAYFNLALLYQSSAQPEEALKYYEKTLSLDPKCFDAIINKAAIYASRGKYSEAIQFYQNAIKIDQNNPEVYYNLALAYYMSDQLVRFRDNLLKAKELYQRNGDTAGLEKVAEYMNKMEEIENKARRAR